MKKISDLAQNINDFLYNAILQSKVYHTFGGEGIRGSAFYALLCIPYGILLRTNEKYGAKLASVTRTSRFLDLRVWLILFAGAVPFLTKYTFLFASGLFAAYIIKAASKDGFAQKPSSLDALIYIFAVFFAFFSGKVSVGGAMSLLSYSVISKSVADGGVRKTVTLTFAGASVLSAVFGRLGGGRIFSEFFILAVPFVFAAAREFEKPSGTIMYGFSVLLALVFATRLSKGNITPAGAALGIFLCMRDMRFVLPAGLAFGALFGRYSVFRDLIAAYSFTAVTGTASFVMSALLYLNLMNYSSKRKLLRTVTAALGSGSVLFLSGGGGAEYMFFTILALTRAMM